MKLVSPGDARLCGKAVSFILICIGFEIDFVLFYEKKGCTVNQENKSGIIIAQASAKAEGEALTNFRVNHV